MVFWGRVEQTPTSFFRMSAPNEMNDALKDLSTLKPDFTASVLEQEKEKEKENKIQSMLKRCESVRKAEKQYDKFVARKDHGVEIGTWLIFVEESEEPIGRYKTEDQAIENRPKGRDCYIKGYGVPEKLVVVS